MFLRTVTAPILCPCLRESCRPAIPVRSRGPATWLSQPGQQDQMNIEVYPTITSNYVNIRIGNTPFFKKKILVSLIDVNGNKHEETILAETTHQKFTFTNHLPGGVYYIFIQSGELSIVKPIVIQ